MLFKANGITTFATYDTQPLEIEVGVISSLGRRYFELMNKFDQLMPLIQTLEIHEIIRPRDADIQRAMLKKVVRGVAGSARNFATGLRHRMNEFGLKEADKELGKAAHRERRGAAEDPKEQVTDNHGVLDRRATIGAETINGPEQAFTEVREGTD